jgi:hypothetical protein
VCPFPSKRLNCNVERQESARQRLIPLAERGQGDGEAEEESVTVDTVCLNNMLT